MSSHSSSSATLKSANFLARLWQRFPIVFSGPEEEHGKGFFQLPGPMLGHDNRLREEYADCLLGSHK